MRMNLIVSSFLALAATRLMAGSPAITANPQPHSGDPMDSCYMQTFGAFDCGTSDWDSPNSMDKYLNSPPGRRWTGTSEAYQ